MQQDPFAAPFNHNHNRKQQQQQWWIIVASVIANIHKWVRERESENKCQIEI